MALAVFDDVLYDGSCLSRVVIRFSGWIHYTQLKNKFLEMKVIIERKIWKTYFL